MYYRFVYLKTISQRFRDEFQMEADSDQFPGVTVYPPIGAIITLRTEGPVRVRVVVSADASPILLTSPHAQWSPVQDITSAPDLAHLDHDWQGIITLRDSVFDLVPAFDDNLPDIPLTRAGDHPVKVTWRYDHSREITDPYDPDPYCEHLTIRFL